MKQIIAILVIACVSLAHGQNTNPEKIPEPIALFLSEHSIESAIAKAEKISDPVHARKMMTKDFMFYVVRPPQVGSDMFIHEICYNAISKEYWIYRIGGISGLIELFGPLKLKTTEPNQRLQTMRFKLPMNSIAQGPHV
jgi:hypothetical protein